MEENDAKHCPKCRLLVTKQEKVCNNTQCFTCKTHLCWKGLEVAPDHDSVYRYMTEKHGRWDDTAQEEFDAMIAQLRPGEAELNGLHLRGGGDPALEVEQSGRQWPEEVDQAEAIERRDADMEAFMTVRDRMAPGAPERDAVQPLP